MRKGRPCYANFRRNLIQTRRYCARYKLIGHYELLCSSASKSGEPTALGILELVQLLRSRKTGLSVMQSGFTLHHEGLLYYAKLHWRGNTELIYT